MTPEDGLPQPEDIAENTVEKARKQQINTLCLNLLAQLNPNVDRDIVKNKFYQTPDLFTDRPLTELKEQTELPGKELNGFDVAMDIARFYWDMREKPDTAVPTKVVFISQGVREPQLSDDPDEKVLVYVDQGYGKGNVNEEFIFTDKRKRIGRGEVKLTRPDVYINYISDAAKGRKQYDYPDKKTFSLRGSQNLILGLPLRESSKFEHVDLSAQGNIAIMPGAYLIGGREQYRTEPVNTRVVLEAVDGDVVQYPNTNVFVNEVSCHNYKQMGGALGNPRLERATINVLDTFEAWPGSERAGPPDLVINNREFLDHIGTSPVEQEIMAREAVLPVPGDGETVTPAVEGGDPTERGNEAESLEEVERRFDDEYPDEDEIRIADTLETIRAYDFSLETDDDRAEYRRFTRLATAASWRFEGETFLGGHVSVRLKKIRI